MEGNISYQHIYSHPNTPASYRSIYFSPEPQHNTQLAKPENGEAVQQHLLRACSNGPLIPAGDLHSPEHLTPNLNTVS